MDDARLAKRDWILAATRALARGGVSAVRIEVLAKELGVTKGSFYWHFKNRRALLAEVLRSWRVAATERIDALVGHRSRDLREQIRLLIQHATRDGSDYVPGGRLEQAIREWANNSATARETLRQVDVDRLEMLTEIYVGTGLRRADALAYAHLLYAFTLGANQIDADVSHQVGQSIRDGVGRILSP
jgi:AcrR family transcriptional regulator